MGASLDNIVGNVDNVRAQRNTVRAIDGWALSAEVKHIALRVSAANELFRVVYRFARFDLGGAGTLHPGFLAEVVYGSRTRLEWLTLEELPYGRALAMTEAFVIVGALNIAPACAAYLRQLTL